MASILRLAQKPFVVFMGCFIVFIILCSRLGTKEEEEEKWRSGWYQVSLFSRGSSKRYVYGRATGKDSSENSPSFVNDQSDMVPTIGDESRLMKKNVTEISMHKFQRALNLKIPFFVSDLAPNIQIPPQYSELLGVFDSKNKNYKHIAKTCSLVSEVSPSAEYHCNISERRSIAPDQQYLPGTPPIKVCGGFVMFPGNCAIPAEGIFKYQERSSRFTESKSSRWCGKAIEEYSIASYDENTGFYQPENCDLAVLEPITLTRKLKGKIILFLGDSYLRQIIRGFIGEIRNQKIILDTHPIEAIRKNFPIFIRYEISEFRDDIRDGFWGPNFDPNELKKCLTNPEAPGACTVVLFIWAPSFASQAEFISKSLHLLAPEVVITSVSASWDQSGPLSSNWTAAWEATPSFPKKFVFVTFPNRRHDLVRTQQISSWLKRSLIMKSRSERIFILHRGCFHFNLMGRSQCSANNTRESTGISIARHHSTFKNESSLIWKNLLQFAVTKHSTCSTYDPWRINRSQKLIKLPAYSTCESWIDRALARTAFTFILH